jgi:two-component system KDP operon response regulator KdpE
MAPKPEILVSEDGYLAMDMVRRQVRAGEQEVKLTPTEFELLLQLMLHAGKVLTHRNILRTVWGPEYGEEADYLRVYVRQLRKKVEADPSQPQYIGTEPGVGYVFRAPVYVEEQGQLRPLTLPTDPGVDNV